MSSTQHAAGVLGRVPAETIAWLGEHDNPAVAVLAGRLLEPEADSQVLEPLWARRNEYAPVAAILDEQLPDGSWAGPSQDYRKYTGSLWQVVFLGELMADPDDERVQRAAAYAFSRQLADGSWSASNAQARGSIPCLTANVGRALARLGFATDRRVVAALAYCADLNRELGAPNCRQAAWSYQLNGYCHMLTAKELLFLGEVPRDSWPDGAAELEAACVGAMRDKEVLRCLPADSREFQDGLWAEPASERATYRQRWIAERGAPTRFAEKPGWLKFGFPLSYNSDALEALTALAGAGESWRPEYEPALALVRSAADSQMRWALRNTFNGKMLANVEKKGQPSKWLTLRTLRVLDHFAADSPAA